ncbi:MAG: hypothetical protein HZC17_00145 [Candidatus Omnitrophica bacterium]|nr:hypothetical protein [Candidatus Omnitrophota bacterium]
MTQGLRNVEDIFYVFGPMYSDVRDIGFALLLVFLTIAFIQEFLNGISNQPNYSNLFIRILLISGLFAVYTPFFREITRGMELLSNFFLPGEDFKEAMQKVFSAYKQNKDLGMLAAFKMTLVEWTLQGTYSLAFIVMKMFGWVRLVFLSALYVMGPIFLAVGVFQPGMVRAWIRWIFEISGWNVVLSLFLRIISEMNFFEIYEKANTPVFDLIAMNFLIIVIIVLFVPLFSSIMVRGAGGLSSAGGAAMGVGAAIIGRHALRGVGFAGTRGGDFLRGLRELGKKIVSPKDSTSSGPRSYKGGN